MELLRAIYDKNLYQESLHHKFTKPLKYWILISIISILISTLSFVISLNGSLPSLEERKDNLPYFEINDGLLSIDEGVEYAEEDVPVIIIDDEYVFQVENFKYVPQYLVATRDSMYIKSSETELKQVFYKDIDLLKNTNKDILLDKLLELIPTEAVVIVVLLLLLFLLLITIFVLVTNFIPLLIYALVGLLTAKIFKKQLKYSNSLKIMLYGNILPILIITTYEIIFDRSINGTLLFIFITVYTGFFISQLKTENMVETVGVEPTSKS